MNAQFTDIPAGEWERVFYADELKEARRADKPARVKASDFAAAFDALFEAAGFIPEARLPLHIFFSQSRGKAPDERMIFSETEAGRLLPGKEGVAKASFRKRWVRAWDEILVPEMARLGKRIGRRVKGSIELAARRREVRKNAPVYFSEIAQAIVDIERAALKISNLKRDERFRLAAEQVWSSLPPYVAPEEGKKLHVPAETQKERLAGNNSRRMNRWQNAAKEMIAEAWREGPRAVDVLRKRLHCELEVLFADAESTTESDAPLLDTNLHISSENHTVSTQNVDVPVHVSVRSEGKGHRGKSIYEEEIIL